MGYGHAAAGADRLTGLVAQPVTRYTLGTFLSLTRDEVAAETERQRHSPTGHIWLGLFHLMARHGYECVREVGTPAANSWATHLQAIDR